MSLPSHRILPRVFGALAAGGGGPEAIHDLAAAEYSKHALLLRRVLSTASASGEWNAPARCGYELLAAAQQHDPAAAETVIMHPSVGAWSLRTLGARPSGAAMPGAVPAGLCGIAVAAAIRARLPREIEVPTTEGILTLPSLGVVTRARGTALVRIGNHGAEVGSAAGNVHLPADPLAEAPDWQPLRRLSLGVAEFVLDDVDPFRMPSVPNTLGRLSSPEVARWAAVCRDGWSLLERHHPGIAAEVVAAVRVLVPLASPPQGQVSSSSGAAFGAVALSQPADGLIFAVTLAHEVQHVKLSALLDIVTLTVPDDGRRFYAPWRPDPRPLSGLLQGAYAYLGVAGFWRQQRRVDPSGALQAATEFARWRLAAAGAAETLLASKQLTAEGTEFVIGMLRTLRPWLDEPVPARAGEQADVAAARHLTTWESAHGCASTR